VISGQRPGSIPERWTMNTDKQTDKTELVFERPQGTNQLAGGPRYRYGKKRVPGCRCTYNFTCGPCLNASGPTK
jgi:hypothetical protein